MSILVILNCDIIHDIAALIANVVSAARIMRTILGSAVLS